MSLSLNKQETCLNNLETIENVDISTLDKLISSSLLLENWRENKDFSRRLYENERKQLSEYRKKIVDNKASVKYFRSSLFGRVSADKSLSLFSFRKCIRHTLANKYYVDIDMVNCHPVILYQLCKKNNIECQELEHYINNRNELLQKVMKYYNISRDEAKQLYLVCLYLGNPEKILQSLNISKPLLREINNFKREIKEIAFELYNNNQLIDNEIKLKKNNKNIKEYNKIGSVCSIVLQELEIRFLETIYLYCIDNNIIENNNVVLCHDGIMIIKEKYNDCLLKQFSNIILEKYNFNMEFVKKEFDETIPFETIEKNQLQQNDILKKQYPTYDFDYVADLNEDFNINTLQQLFNEDKNIFGVENYITNFSHTKSFKYFNPYHIFIYQSDKLYKIYKNTIEPYSNKKPFTFLTVKGKLKFMDLYYDNENKHIHSNFLFEPNLLKNIGDRYNLFKGFYYHSDNNSYYDEEIVETFINHIEYLCKETNNGDNKEDRPLSQYLINWIASIIQKPFEKTKVAIGFYSIVEGVGKNILTDILSKIFKGYSSKFRDTSALTDKFNADMMGKLFVVGDEINGRVQEVANELKDIITRTTENVEFKGKDKFIIDDYKNYIFTTNNENVFKVSNNDRRFCLIECPEEKQTNEYYQRLFNILNNDESLKSIYNFFNNIDISEFNVRDIPISEYKLRLIEANAPAYIKFFKDNFMFLSQIDSCNQPREWKTEDLYKECIEYAKKNKMISSFTEMTFLKEIKKVFECFNKKNKQKQSVYVFPPSDKCVVLQCIKNNYVNKLI